MSLCDCTAMQLQALTIPQLRRLSSLIEDSIRRCNDERVHCETQRSEALVEIGNLLHDSVIVSNDEVTTSLTCVVVVVAVVVVVVVFVVVVVVVVVHFESVTSSHLYLTYAGAGCRMTMVSCRRGATLKQRRSIHTST